MSVQTQNETKPHSQDFFGEWRDFWWNRDFLELMARRWKVETVKTVLDVGCGIGHWGRALLPVLPKTTTLVGVDMEPESVAKAREIARSVGLEKRTSYALALAEKLPFPDSSFDMVTCQTVLIHVKDIHAVLSEMHRVLKPGGLLVVVEPNNAASRLVETTVSFDEPIEKKLALVKLALICERGKANLGLGHNSVGDILPQFISRAQFVGVESYLSDKTWMYLPPYESPEQQANVKQSLEWSDSGFFMWSEPETRRYFTAGGGSDAEFMQLWEVAKDFSLRARDAMLARTFSTAGGGVFYLISARRE